MAPTKKQPPRMTNPPIRRTPLTLKKPRTATKMSKWQKTYQEDIEQIIANVQNRLELNKDLPNLRNFLIYIYRSISWSYSKRLSEQKIYDKWYEVISPYLGIMRWELTGHTGSISKWNAHLETLCDEIFPLAEWQRYTCKTEKIKEFEYRKIFDLSAQGGKKNMHKTNKKARKSHKKTKKTKKTKKINNKMN